NLHRVTRSLQHITDQLVSAEQYPEELTQFEDSLAVLLGHLADAADHYRRPVHPRDRADTKRHCSRHKSGGTNWRTSPSPTPATRVRGCVHKQVSCSPRTARSRHCPESYPTTTPTRNRNGIAHPAAASHAVP